MNVQCVLLVSTCASRHVFLWLVSLDVLLFVTACACEGRPHRRWSWGLRSLRRPHGGWRCCGSCSSPPAWSSWPSWPPRWLRWQQLPPLLSGLERNGRALTHCYVFAGAEALHLQNRFLRTEVKTQWKELWNNTTVNHFYSTGEEEPTSRLSCWWDGSLYVWPPFLKTTLMLLYRGRCRCSRCVSVCIRQTFCVYVQLTHTQLDNPMWKSGNWRWQRYKYCTEQTSLWGRFQSSIHRIKPPWIMPNSGIQILHIYIL